MWKFVIIEVTIRGTTRRVPVLFPSSLVHSMMADVMKQYFVEEARGGGHEWAVQPVAAGECQLEITHVGGKSDTLELTPGSFDANWLNLWPYHHGVV